MPSSNGPARQEEARALPVEELGLPPRIIGGLRGHGMDTVGSVVDAGRYRLLYCRGIGERAVGLIQAALADLGMELPRLERGAVKVSSHERLGRRPA